jgi:hypothetical protein
MRDRYEQTAADARTAIQRADVRAAAVRRRRREIERQLAALRGPGSGWGPASVTAAIAVTRARLAAARLPVRGKSDGG